MFRSAFEIAVAGGLIVLSFIVLLWPVIGGGVVALFAGWWPWGLVAGAVAAGIWFPGLLSGRMLGRTGDSTFDTSRTTAWWVGTVSASAAFGAAGAGVFALVEFGLGEI